MAFLKDVCHGERFQKTLTIPSVSHSLLYGCPQLLLQHHAYLPAAMLPTIMIKDSVMVYICLAQGVALLEDVALLE